ncbi:uncharacterized protein LOC143894740 [Temnothorax americanus]|uniref:uncharacterized protein LOC143894740 n=1 Tax=Temnothorax americanus TaxID=1964332 RepID=UPI004068DEF0
MKEMSSSDLKKQYKKPPINFGKTKKIKVSLADEQRKRRRTRRTLNFEENRKESSPCSTVSQNDDPKTKLLKWRVERKRKKETQASKKKPPFIVGIVRHHIYSPVSSSDDKSTVGASVAPKEKKKTVAQVHTNSNIKKGITKATEKRLLARAAKDELKQKSLATSVFTKKSSETKTSSNDKVESDHNRRDSFAPSNHKFNPPAGLPKILFGEVKIEDGLSNENNIFIRDKLMETTDQEPFRCNSNSIEAITLKMSSDEQETSDSSREKQANLMVETISNGNNVHETLLTAIEKENCSKDLTSFPKCPKNTEDNIKTNEQDNSDLCQVSDLTDKLAIKGAIMKNPDVPMEKKYTVEYFERVWKEEKHRLQKLCEEWTEIQSQDGIKEDIRCQINQAVGQTTMLIKEKFKQFYRLILDCERKDGNVLVTCTDLHGFWDTMYIEVKDCDSRFEKLEKLRARCWQEDQSSSAISTRSKENIVTKKRSVPVRKSSLQSIISSDKKKKMAKIQVNKQKRSLQEITSVSNDQCITPCITNKKALSVYRRNSDLSHKERFLEVSNNGMYTSTPLAVNNVMSKTSNQLSTPLITMKVSQLYNKFTMLLNDTTLYITPEQTPKMSPIGKSERLVRSKSLRAELAYETDSKDHFTTIKSTDEKLELDQNSQVSSKKINKSNELHSNEPIHNEEKSNSGTNSSSARTVIEKSPNKKNSTFILSPYSTDLPKTPTESKSSVKESSSKKSSKIRSFGRSARHSIVNKIISSFGVPATLNSLNLPSTSRNASLKHDVRNSSSKMTPSTDRVSKKRNSSIKAMHPN